MTTTTVSGQRLRCCWKCRQWKSLPEFYRDRRDSEGRATICSVCARAAYKAYRAANLDEVRQRDRVRDRIRRARAADIERFLAATIAPTNHED